MQGKLPIAMLSILYASAFLGGFNENLMNMALVSIMSEFSISSVTAQWLVTGYMIVATVVVMSMAYFYRRFKLRTLFFAASCLSLVGSLAGLFAANFWMLMAARIVQAVGTGIFIPMMINTVLATVPKNRLGVYMSIGSCMITFGPAFAPVVCGGIVTLSAWRFVFLPPAVAGLVLLAPVLINAIVAIFSGRIMDHWGEWPLLPTGFFVIFAGFLMVAAFSPSLSLVAVVIGSLGIFTGVGMVLSTSQTAGLRTLPPEENPFGVALCTTFVYIAACVGPALFTGIMSGFQGDAVASGVSPDLACAHGFSMAVATAIAFVGFATAFAYARKAAHRCY